MIGTAAAAAVVASIICALKMLQNRQFISNSKCIFSFCCSLRQTRGGEKKKYLYGRFEGGNKSTISAEIFSLSQNAAIKPAGLASF